MPGYDITCLYYFGSDMRQINRLLDVQHSTLCFKQFVYKEKSLRPLSWVCVKCAELNLKVLQTDLTLAKFEQIYLFNTHQPLLKERLIF